MRWYVQRAEQFIRSLSGRRLADLSRQDIDDYLGRLGHSDGSTTQIFYTHVLNRGGLAVRSPLDTQ